MNTVTYEISLNLDINRNIKHIFVKQGDSGSRVINAKIFAGSVALTIDSGSTAKLRLVTPKPDCHAYESNATSVGTSSIIVPISDEMMSIAGPAYADIVITGPNDETISTELFCVEIEKSPVR